MNSSKNTTITHRIISIISIVISISVVVLSIIQMFGVWDKAINISCPLLGLELLCLAYTNMKNNKKVAYFSIGAAVFIFICSIIVFFC